MGYCIGLDWSRITPVVAQRGAFGKSRPRNRRGLRCLAGFVRECHRRRRRRVHCGGTAMRYFFTLAFLDSLHHHISSKQLRGNYDTPDTQHENVDQFRTEPGFVLSVPKRRQHRVAWCENGAEPGKLRQCIALGMRHGALTWRARRDRHARDGLKCFSRGVYGDGAVSPKNREPSVGDAERVSAREPPYGQFLAGSSSVLGRDSQYPPSPLTGVFSLR